MAIEVKKYDGATVEISYELIDWKETIHIDIDDELDEIIS